MKKLLSLLVLGAAALSMHGAHAHGNTKPEHGGIVSLVGETMFELVNKADSVELYVADDDEPLASAGLSAKLIVTNGTEKSDISLKPAGDNKFEATGVKLQRGAKVGVVVTLANKRKLTTTFILK